MPRVEDEDRSSTDDRHQAFVTDLGGGVLVDADPDQIGGVRDDRQQPPVAAALIEMLVDHDTGDQAQPGRELTRPLARRHALVAEGDHELAHDRGSRRGSGDDRPPLVGPVDRIADGRADDVLAELELAPARHEDPGRRVQSGHQLRGRGGSPGRRVDDLEVLASLQPGKDAPIERRRLGREGRCGRDDDDPRRAPACQSDEPAQHHRAPELVLGASDDEQGAAHRR